MLLAETRRNHHHHAYDTNDHQCEIYRALHLLASYSTSETAVVIGVINARVLKVPLRREIYFSIIIRIYERNEIEASEAISKIIKINYLCIAAMRTKHLK